MKELPNANHFHMLPIPSQQKQYWLVAKTGFPPVETRAVVSSVAQREARRQPGLRGHLRLLGLSRFYCLAVYLSKGGAPYLPREPFAICSSVSEHTPLGRYQRMTYPPPIIASQSHSCPP